MATPEEQVGAAFAEQIKQMQAEGQAFSPVSDKLKEAQDKILESFLNNAGVKQAPAHPMAGNEDFNWIVMQLTQNPLVIPYFRKNLEKALVKLRDDIAASLASSLGPLE